MLKGFTALEHKIGERVYHLMCAPDAPLGEVHDAIAKMKEYVVQRMYDQHKAETEAAAKASEKPPCAE